MIKRLKHLFSNHGSRVTNFGARCAQRGASLLETILAIALVMALAPYMYYRINETSQEITDISIAKKIVGYEASAMNYVRMNQNFWGPVARIEMDGTEVNDAFETTADKYINLAGAFITKSKSGDGSSFEVFLDFNIDGADEVRITKIAKLVGGDAAVVTDGVAYGVYGNWSARSDVFQNGDIVYRIVQNLAGGDSEKFLHRTVLGDEKLNVMERDFSIGGNVVYDVGDVFGESVRISNATAFFANADYASARELVFPNGANMDPTNALFKHIRVIGDIVGFRNIVARRFVGRGGTGNWSRQGSIIADRANISDAVHVGRNLYIRSNTVRTVSGFSGAVAHSVYTPFLSTTELYFTGNFGITVSSELISSTLGAPLKLGSWSFPSNSMPKINTLILGRLGNADVAGVTAVKSRDFIKIIGSGWKDVPAKQQAGANESAE